MTDKSVALERVCFQLQVDPDRIEEYKQAHAAVWPEMLKALYEAGWRNYSIFMRDDGLITLYFETPSLVLALDGMAEREVNARWQIAMRGLLLDLNGVSPDIGFVKSIEVFNLETQLAAHYSSGTDISSVLPRAQRSRRDFYSNCHL